MLMHSLRVFLVAVFLFPAMAMSQDATSSDDETERLEATESQAGRSKPYEIVITPTLTRLDLRGLIENVEEDFFARFNELNIDKDYDIVCYKHTPPMTHISERVCEPLFLIRARGDNAADTMFLLGSGGKDAINQAQSAANSISPDTMKRDKRSQFEILQEKMEAFNRSDEELRSIGSVLAQLKARLENFGKDD